MSEPVKPQGYECDCPCGGMMLRKTLTRASGKPEPEPDPGDSENLWTLSCRDWQEVNIGDGPSVRSGDAALSALRREEYHGYEVHQFGGRTP